MHAHAQTLTENWQNPAMDSWSHTILRLSKWAELTHTVCQHPLRSVCVLVCVCVYSKHSSSRPLQRGLIESIQFPILLCSGLATVCQQGTRTIHTVWEAAIINTSAQTHTLDSLERLIGFASQSDILPDTTSRSKVHYMPWTCCLAWIYRCPACLFVNNSVLSDEWDFLPECWLTGLYRGGRHF